MFLNDNKLPWEINVHSAYNHFAKKTKTKKKKTLAAIPILSFYLNEN